MTTIIDKPNNLFPPLPPNEEETVVLEKINIPCKFQYIKDQN